MFYSPINWSRMDLRTGIESTSPDNVLDGDLNAFMEAALAHQLTGSEGAVVEDLE